MEATVAATFSQQRPRFHKLERTCPWVAYESRCPCTWRVPHFGVSGVFIFFV
jgi:hypothetical protein